MLLTCYACPRKLAFAGTHHRRRLMARLFGWIEIAGRFFCDHCGADL